MSQKGSYVVPLYYFIQELQLISSNDNLFIVYENIAEMFLCYTNILSRD
jgi:hypothetical protein